MVNGFIDHLYAGLRTTSNYSATNNLHNSQITTAPAKCIHPAVSSPAVPWQRLLTVEILQLHALRSSLHSLPWRTHWSVNSLAAISHQHPSLLFTAGLSTQHWIELNWTDGSLAPLLITSRHGPRRKRLFLAIPIFLRAYALHRERVYRAVA
jgi:hypothetical protein